MNYDKIKRTGILFLLGIGAITSLSCNDNDNANSPERVPPRLSVMPLPERVDYKESVVSLPQNVTVSQNIPASTSQLLKSTLEEKLSLSVSDASNDRAFIRVKQESDLAKEAYRLRYQRGSLRLLFNGNRTSLGNPDIETSARTSKFLHFRKC